MSALSTRSSQDSRVREAFGRPRHGDSAFAIAHVPASIAPASHRVVSESSSCRPVSIRVAIARRVASATPWEPPRPSSMYRAGHRSPGRRGNRLVMDTRKIARAALVSPARKGTMCNAAAGPLRGHRKSSHNCACPSRHPPSHVSLPYESFAILPPGFVEHSTRPVSSAEQ